MDYKHTLNSIQIFMYCIVSIILLFSLLRYYYKTNEICYLTKVGMQNKDIFIPYNNVYVNVAEKLYQVIIGDATTANILPIVESTLYNTNDTCFQNLNPPFNTTKSNKACLLAQLSIDGQQTLMDCASKCYETKDCSNWALIYKDFKNTFINRLKNINNYDVYCITGDLSSNPIALEGNNNLIVLGSYLNPISNGNNLTNVFLSQ